MDFFWTLWVTVFVTLVGATIGSFLNVCISRIPEGVSIVRPASRCPQCGHPIRFYDNIPVLSFLMLGGKCRDCGNRISFLYPVVEILTAFFAFMTFHKFGLTPLWGAVFLFICVLVVISFIDLDHQIIPHVLTLTGIPVFAILAVFIKGLAIGDVFLGIMVGAGSLYFVAVYYEALTGREGMGGGDVNLLAMLGGFFCWESIFFVVFISSLLGAVAGFAIILSKGKDMRYAIPFGPFLCMAAVIYIFWGNALLRLFGAFSI
ncbi:MAG: prepilin peptidase [Lentisphaerae bacterium]|nr:prepilin peptidase [Lentisphaerota bacterium]